MTGCAALAHSTQTNLLEPMLSFRGFHTTVSVQPLALMPSTEASRRSVIFKSPHTYMVKGGGIGGFAGGFWGHHRLFLGAWWVGLFLGVPNCGAPPVAV